MKSQNAAVAKENNNFENVFSHAEEKFRNLKLQLASDEMVYSTLSNIEDVLQKEGTELLRLLMQGFLDLLSQRESMQPNIQGSDGVLRRQKRLNKSRRIESQFGEAKVHRIRYEGTGVDSRCPLDAQLNLPKEKYSLKTQKRVIEESIRGSFDGTVEALDKTTGAHVPKRQAEEIVQRASQDFEAFYQSEKEHEPNKLQFLQLTVLTSDAKGILVHHDDLRPATKQSAEESIKEKQRLPHPLPDVSTITSQRKYQKRMAQAASVYHLNRHERTAEEVVRQMQGLSTVEGKKRRPKPENKRVWASIEKDCHRVIDSTVEEALLRDPEQMTQWVATVDGDPKQILIYENAKEKFGLKDLVIICDIIHVLGYLWKAGKALHPRNRSKTEQWVIKHLLELLRGKCSSVAAGIRRSATKLTLTEKQREPIDSCADYLLNHKEFLKYDEYLKAGYPISTGVIEGTVRHLINDRMALTGARWRLKTAEGVLKFRSLRSSNDLDAYWEYHEQQEFQRNHVSRYAQGKIPEVISREGAAYKGHLTLVK